MTRALLYLQLMTMRNRLLVRLRRLRQPKYLVGGLVGLLWMYFYFFRYLFTNAARNPAGWWTPENLALIESGGALVLGLFLLLAWVLPNKRAALAFTEAEIAFLFPAPVTRRTLIRFKLLRSQLGILFTVLILALVFRRMPGNPLIHALGYWLILSTINLHLMGVSFLRTMLLDRGITNRTRRGVILLVAAAVIAGVVIWTKRTLPSGAAIDVTDLDALKQWFTTVLTSGPLPYLLYPLRLLVRPYLAQDWVGFLPAVWPALLIVLVHYGWVIRADVAFEEASLEASRKMAERVAAVRAGRGHEARKRKPGRAPFTLKPKGMAAVALLWKNLIAAGSAFNARLLVILFIVATFVVIGMGRSNAQGGLPMVLGMVSMMFLLWSFLLGPQFLRVDLRRDLPMADVLKTYPMVGWKIVLGELLAPVAILSAVQWLLIPLALAAFVPLVAKEGGDRSLALGAGLALAISGPAINLIAFIIPNLSVLLLPAWFQSDKTGPHGVEAMGQRIIIMFAQVLMLMVCLLAPGAVFVLVLFAVKWFAGWLAGFALAAVVGGALLIAEGAVGIGLMGRLFERFDISGEVIA